MGFLYTFFYQPIYNLFSYILAFVPEQIFWVAVVGTVVFVRILLLPFSIKATLTQIKIQKIQPEILRIKKHKDKQKQTKDLLELYKTNKINPLSTLGTLILQISFLLTLFFVFRNTEFQPEVLYGFVANLLSVGSIDVTFLDKTVFDSPVIALILAVGISQFLSIKLAQKRLEGAEKTQFARMMTFQLTYVLPVVVMLFAPLFTTAIILYWVTNNIFSIFQDLFINKFIVKLKTT